MLGRLNNNILISLSLGTHKKLSDPPEIVVENPIVYSGEGQEATLSCIVHGETQPEVIT